MSASSPDPRSLRTMEGWVQWGRTLVDPEDAGRRLDVYLARRFTYRSRTGWAQKIREGRMRVGGERVRPSYLLKAGDLLQYRADPLPEPEVETRCPTLHEDESLLAVNKSGNIPVHPAGRYFRNCLLHLLSPRGAKEPHLRVVHRLDRETSGVVVFAKSAAAARSLGRQFEERTVRKSYLAVVWGTLTGERDVDLPLGYRPSAAIAKAVGIVPGGRPARTRLRPLASRDGVTLVEAIPLTGRLHQIRVHLQASGFPILGDRLYGRDPRLFLKSLAGPLDTDDDAFLGFRRQALHALKLAFDHPETGGRLEIVAAPPEDFSRLLKERGLDGGLGA